MFSKGIEGGSGLNRVPQPVSQRVSGYKPATEPAGDPLWPRFSDLRNLLRQLGGQTEVREDAVALAQTRLIQGVYSGKDVFKQTAERIVSEATSTAVTGS